MENEASIDEEIRKLEIEYHKANMDLERAKEKYKDELDIPWSMCDRLIYPQEVSDASSKSFRIAMKLYDARKKKRELQHSPQKIIDRLKVKK